jgi:hypothetical protein
MRNKDLCGGTGRRFGYVSGVRDFDMVDARENGETGFGVSPGDLARFLSERWGKRRDAIAEYLDGVEEEAEAIYILWEKVALQLREGPFAPSRMSEQEQAVWLGAYVPRHRLIRATLRTFHSELSLLLGEQPDWEPRESIFWHLGALQTLHELTRKAYTDRLNAIGPVFFFAPGNSLPEFADPDRMPHALRKEVDALKLLLRRARLLLS